MEKKAWWIERAPETLSESLEFLAAVGAVVVHLPPDQAEKAGGDVAVVIAGLEEQGKPARFAGDPPSRDRVASSSIPRVALLAWELVQGWRLRKIAELEADIAEKKKELQGVLDGNVPHSRVRYF